MGTHPNVILLLRLSPDGLARKTHADICEESGIARNSEKQITIGEGEYHHLLMEEDYNESWQLSGKEGDILIFNLVTYGYGEAILWEKLQEQKQLLEMWAQGICERHHCTYKISVTANYW